VTSVGMRLEVVKLANMHPRVNIHLPGPGVGGPCLPKQPIIKTLLKLGLKTVVYDHICEESFGAENADYLERLNSIVGVMVRLDWDIVFNSIL